MSCRSFCLTLSVLSLVFVGGAPGLMAGPIYVGLTIDPTGDASGGPDITLAKILIDATQYTFRMEFAPGTFDPLTAKSGFALDLDQNPSTGYLENGLGAEAAVVQGYLGDTQNAYLYIFSPFSIIASTTVTFGANSVEYSFSRSLLPDDGLLNYIASVQIAFSSSTAWGVNDFAPEPYHPASTSMVPEPTSLLLLGSGLGAIGLAAWRKRK